MSHYLYLYIQPNRAGNPPIWCHASGLVEDYMGVTLDNHFKINSMRVPLLYIAIGSNIQFSSINNFNFCPLNQYNMSQIEISVNVYLVFSRLEY